MDYDIQLLLTYFALYPIATIIGVGIFMFFFLCEFWGRFVLVMGIYRVYLDDKAHGTNNLRGINKVFGIYHVVLGYIIDFVANIFVAWIWFTPWADVWYMPWKWEWPREKLVTSRLIRYLETMPPESLQYKRAFWICHSSLDLFDPTGDHCSISK